MSKYSECLYGLNHHCIRLSQAISVFDDLRTTNRISGASQSPLQKDKFDLESAALWLDVAGSVKAIEIDTTAHNDGCTYCSNVWEYQSKRSDILSTLVFYLTVFSFTWNAFEICVSWINPKKVPEKLKPRTSFVDEAIYFLKTNYTKRNIPYLDDILTDFRVLIQSQPDYSHLHSDFRLEPHMSLTGLGIHIVRKIRNKFAHGDASLPEPDGWSFHEPRDPELINLSTKIVLLTIQALIICSCDDSGPYLDEPFLIGGYKTGDDLRSVFATLHIKGSEVSDKQLSLW